MPVYKDIQVEIDGNYYVNNVLIVNKTYKLSEYYEPSDKLIKEVINAFNQMKEDASKDNINIWILSHYRSYEYQEKLYNNYLSIYRDNADNFSAKPGHSEHQSGLAIDVNDVSYNFLNTKESKWLNDNCYKYGFIIRYPKDKEKYTGYNYEPWHIRYVGTKLSTILHNKGNWISLEEYFELESKYY